MQGKEKLRTHIPGILVLSAYGRPGLYLLGLAVG